MLIITPQLQIPLREFQFTFARSSGPGGQNVNKVNTKALLRWPVMTSPSLPEAVRQRLLPKCRRQRRQLEVTAARREPTADHESARRPWRVMVKTGRGDSTWPVASKGVQQHLLPCKGYCIYDFG